MKRFKSIAAVVTAVSVLGVTGAAYAATALSPAEIVSGLTGKPATELYQERSAGKTYGTIAREAGKLEEFKAQMLGQKKIILNQRVGEGRLTQTQAEEIYSSIKNNQANCNGSGNAAIGKKYGAGFGQGKGKGPGQSAGMGTARGMNR